jgi:hypothetical protein
MAQRKDGLLVNIAHSQKFNEWAAASIPHGGADPEEGLPGSLTHWNSFLSLQGPLERLSHKKGCPIKEAAN